MGIDHPTPSAQKEVAYASEWVGSGPARGHMTPEITRKGAGSVYTLDLLVLWGAL